MLELNELFAAGTLNFPPMLTNQHECARLLHVGLMSLKFIQNCLNICSCMCSEISAKQQRAVDVKLIWLKWVPRTDHGRAKYTSDDCGECVAVNWHVKFMIFCLSSFRVIRKKRFYFPKQRGKYFLF